MLTFVITMVKLHCNMVLRIANFKFYFLHFFYILAQYKGYTDIINAITSTTTTTTKTTTTTLSPNDQLILG